MPTSRRKKWTVGLVALAALITAIGGLWVTRRHELLEHATRITEGDLRAYVWQSSDKLAFLRLHAPGQMDEFEQRDMAAGTQTLGSIGPVPSGTLVWRASSDGHRLLTYDDTPSFYVVGQPGTGVHQVDFSGETDGRSQSPLPAVAWLPDGHRWMAWSPSQSKHNLKLYSVDAPDSASVSISAPMAMTALVGVTPDNLVVQADAPPPPLTATKVTVTTFGVYPNRAAVTATSFPLPVTAQIKELELAPQGDRLAWLFVDARRSPLVTMLVRLLPTLASRFPPTEGISVWVSRRDGTEFHEIGFQQTQLTGKNTNVATDLRWMPGGKRLSFLMNDALYSVPAP